MMKRDLNAIKCVIAAIESAEKNISRLERFKTFNELLVVPYQPKIKEIIRQMGYSDEENPNPVYYSGKDKDAILDLMISKNESFKTKMNEKLENEINQIS